MCILLVVFLLIHGVVTILMLAPSEGLCDLRMIDPGPTWKARSRSGRIDEADFAQT